MKASDFYLLVAATFIAHAATAAESLTIAGVALIFAAILAANGK